MARRLRIMLYEGPEADLDKQMGPPGLPDGVHQFRQSVVMTVATYADPDFIRRVMNATQNLGALGLIEQEPPA